MAIVAVLKTGAAYVPIDPVVPAARMEFLLDDAALIAAVTTGGLASGCRGMAWGSSMSTIPLSTAIRVRRCGCRPPMRSLT